LNEQDGCFLRLLWLMALMALLKMRRRMTRVTKSPDGPGICYCGSTCGGPVYMASLCITRTGNEVHRRVGIIKNRKTY